MPGSDSDGFGFRVGSGSVQAYSIQGGFGFSAELRLRWFGFRVGSGKWVQVHYRVQVSYSGVQVGFV